MSNFYIWRRGLTGPTMVKLIDDPALVDYDRRHKLTDPKPIATEHDELSLTELAKVYPPPEDTSDAPTPSVVVQRPEPV